MPDCRIAVLDPRVVEQIAAGEVIDRPASVVKELIENAVDAGARSITIEIDDDVRTLRVTDDGAGMNRAELVLCLTRHATSKLRLITDLDRIRTLGFRGEGLASVAACADLTISSRVAAEPCGWRLAGGELSPVAQAVGTTVLVERLFANAPVREKFLKSAAAEAGRVTEMVSRMACAHPSIAFVLRNAKRPVIDLPAAADRLTRARAAMRRGGHLLGAFRETDGIAVELCLCPAEQALSTSRQLFVLVNGRAVRDRGVVAAVVHGYGDALRGRFPFGVVYLDIVGDQIDVNVHPQKLEVRFADAARVYRAVRRAVGKLTGAVVEPPTRSYRLQSDSANDQRLRGGQRLHEAAQRFWSAAVTSPLGGSVEAARSPGEFGVLRVVGQVFSGRTLVCERTVLDRQQLVLIDILRAQQCLVERQLKRALEHSEPVSQRLLLAVTVKLSAEHQRAVIDYRPLVEQLGFEIEPFDQSGAWVIRALPAALASFDPERVLCALTSALLATAADPDKLIVRLADLATRDAEPSAGAQILGALDRAGLTIGALADRERAALRLIDGGASV